MDFNEAQKLLKLQQEATRIKKELENTFIESEVDGLVITFNGEMKITKVEFEDTKIIGNKEALEKAILEAGNKGVKKSQELAAGKMQGVMSQMGMGDMLKGGVPGLQ